MNIQTLSDEQLAGQRLMVGFEGTEFNEDLRLLIDKLKVGGVILFKRNIETPDQINALCQAIKSYAVECGQPPLFIAIDQEGGEVARLKAPFTQFPGNPKMKDESDAVNFAKVTAGELTGIHVNMNMVPVLDIAPKNIESVMARRAFGDDPQRVAMLGTTVIRELQQRKIMAVGKHFPGIGRTTLDSHLDLPSLDIDFTLLQDTDLIPFYAAIAENVAGMMISHIRYEKLDNKWPASLSSRISKDLLRDKMGYGGVVVTDDLDMGAIVNHYPIETVITQLLEADIDIAMICQKSANIKPAFGKILNITGKSNRMREKALKSVGRILDLKRKYLGIEELGN